MYGLYFGSAMAAASQASAASSAARHAASAASDARSTAHLVEADVERLFMITEALWTILKEERGYSDDDLMARIEEIDMRDGKLDGRVAAEPKPECPECGRVLIGHHPLCLYCGTAIQREPFER